MQLFWVSICLLTSLGSVQSFHACFPATLRRTWQESPYQLDQASIGSAFLGSSLLRVSLSYPLMWFIMVSLLESIDKDDGTFSAYSYRVRHNSPVVWLSPLNEAYVLDQQAQNNLSRWLWWTTLVLDFLTNELFLLQLAGFYRQIQWNGRRLNWMPGPR